MPPILRRLVAPIVAPRLANITEVVTEGMLGALEEYWARTSLGRKVSGAGKDLLTMIGQNSNAPILVYGQVQSGKTGGIQELIANASDAEDSSLIIVLTTDNRSLAGQTYSRLMGPFEGGIKSSTGNEVLFHYGREKAPDGVGRELMHESHQLWASNAFALYRSRCQHSMRRGVGVLMARKNSRRLMALEKIIQMIHGALLTKCKQGELPRLILVDDEADHASLNANASQSNKEPTPVYATIQRIRDQWSGNSSYLQFTATPQAILSLTKQNPQAAGSVYCLEPGREYQGIQVFFPPDTVEPSPYVVASPEAGELFPPLTSLELLPRMQAPWRDYVARLAWGVVEANGSIPETPRDFLIHPSHLKVDHQLTKEIVESLCRTTIASLETNDSGQLAPVRRACARLENILGERGRGLVANLDNHAFRTILASLLRRLQIVLYNSVASFLFRERNKGADGKRNSIVYIGGTALGRGVSFEYLSVMLLLRWQQSEIQQMDTMLQAARFLGYRTLLRQQEIIVHLSDGLAKTYRIFAQADKDLRRQLSGYHQQVGQLYHGVIRHIGTNTIIPSSPQRMDQGYNAVQAFNGQIISLPAVPKTGTATGRSEADRRQLELWKEAGTWSVSQSHLTSLVPGKSIQELVLGSCAAKRLSYDEESRLRAYLNLLSKYDKVHVFRIMGANPATQIADRRLGRADSGDKVKNFSMNPGQGNATDDILRRLRPGGIFLHWFEVSDAEVSSPLLGYQLWVEPQNNLVVRVRDHTQDLSLL